MNRKKIFFCILAAILLTVSLFAGCSKKNTASEAPAKTITVTVVYADGTTRDYPITTKQVYLSGALHEKGLLTDAEYKAGDGKYTVIDGVTANYDRDAAWWCVTKGGEWVDVGMNQLKIADGDRYELTYTVG